MNELIESLKSHFEITKSYLKDTFEIYIEIAEENGDFTYRIGLENSPSIVAGIEDTEIEVLSKAVSEAIKFIPTIKHLSKEEFEFLKPRRNMFKYIDDVTKVEYITYSSKLINKNTILSTLTSVDLDKDINIYFINTL